MYSQTYQSPTVPQRIVLNPNLHYGRRDTTSFDPASTVKPVAVSRTTKVVAVIQTSGSKDCPIRPSKIMITPAKKQSKSWFISSRRIRRSVASRPEAKSRVQSIQRAVEENDQQHGKHGVLRDLRNHSQSTVPQLCDVLDGRHWKLHLRDELATLRQNSKTKQESLWCFVDSKRRHESPYHGARHGNTQEQRNHHAAHVSNKKAKKNGYKSILDRFLNSPRYRHRMEPRTLRTLRCDCGRRSLLFRHSSRALQTFKYFGACAQQFRSKRPDEPTWRLPRSHQHQRWRVWKSEHKTPSQWASSTTTRSTICLARWRKWKSRP